ncbi:DUF916 and DUF3324 domain-containing protein [Lacticaseibacillus saniviri]|nr:DUF916 and DUF3324 domain-containing protein [Lacticaseibacillus saniviri]MCG4283061.1 DUF916 and DUF3324 domain-containing protein [Lacticaseibacillus saniviri]
MRGKLILGLLAMVTIGLLPATHVKAESSKVPFSIRLQYPSNQVNTNAGYYELKVTPSQEQTLSVVVSNTSDKTITVAPQVHTATTNLNGVVNYTTAGKSDKTLLYRLDKLLKPEQKKYQIPAKSSVVAKLKLNAPTKEFDGTLAGGLSFTQTDELKQKASGTAQVRNRYAYAVAVLLKSKTAVVAPDLKLGDVEVGQMNGTNSVIANVRNVKPAYLNKVKMTTKIYKEKGKKPLYTRNQQNIQIAPNSVMPATTPLNNDAFVPGKYRIEMVIHAGNRSWRFQQVFTITADEAKKWNTATLGHNPIPDNRQWWWYLGGGALVGLMIIAYLIYRNQRLKRQVA